MSERQLLVGLAAVLRILATAAIIVMWARYVLRAPPRVWIPNEARLG